MKKTISLLIAIYLLLPPVSAQETDLIRRPALGFSIDFNDYLTPARIRSGSITQVLRDKQWAKMGDYGIGIGLSYFKGLQKHIDLATTLAGTWSKIPNLSGGDNKFLLEGDASAQFKMMTEKYYVIPYLSAGVGASKYGGYYGAFVPLGIGFRFNLFPEADIFLNSQYRIPVVNGTNDYHFFYNFGVAGNIGRKKTAPVKTVEIPQIKDTDGDGIPDDKDKCPTVAGVAKYDGCPIPDTDGDGINDELDKCPTVPGVARYQGCPVPDTDGDGINDEEDKCPTVPGVKENQGCPVISEEVKKKIDFAAKNIYFASGSYKLLSKSFKGLNEVVQIMKDNADTKLAIDGYTDNTGKADKNQILSENRANAVKQYLVSKGIVDQRFNSAGHGQGNPVATNKTATGRAKNRRVELKLGY